MISAIGSVSVMTGPSSAAIVRTTSASRSDEPVAESALGPDVARVLRVVAELVAQAPDVDPQVVDLVDVLAAPDLGQQRAVLEHVPGIPDEVIEELVLGRGEVESLP